MDCTLLPDQISCGGRICDDPFVKLVRELEYLYGSVENAFDLAEVPHLINDNLFRDLLVRGW